MINGFDVNIVATGSGGNLTILDGVLALDMGVPFKNVRPLLKALKLVFIGHEHGDHFAESTIRAVAKARTTIRFCVGPFLEDKLIAAGIDKRNIDVLEPGKRYDYGVFALEPVRLHHNVPCFGLRIYRTDGRKCFYAVDTGDLEGITAPDYDLYLVEANHTRDEMEARVEEKMRTGQFAYEIEAAKNHLSYEQAADWLAGNMGTLSLWIPMHGHKNTEGGNDDGV